MFILRVHSVDTNHPLSLEDADFTAVTTSKTTAAAESDPKTTPKPKFSERRGIAHLFRKIRQSSLPCPASRSPILFVVAVPNYLSFDDFIRFCGSRIDHVLELVFIRNDGMEDRYSVLIECKNRDTAGEFYSTFNGRKYSPGEAELCHILFLQSVDYTESEEIAGIPEKEFTELPTCPVCLERLDADTSGIASTLCDHSFQCPCISKWTYLSCQVCRLCQQQDEKPACSVCGISVNPWICIICGFVGCGRYTEGHAVKHSKPFLFLDKAPKIGSNKDLGFCMGLGSAARSDESSRESTHEVYDQEEGRRSRVSSDPPLQLNLLPSAPVPRSRASSQLSFPWLTDNLAVSEPAGSSDGPGIGFDVNRMPGVVASAEEAEDTVAPLSSPNSTVSSFQMDFGMRSGGRSSKRDMEVDADRASDDEENGSTRKKLRLSKDQSAFLEESFKEHSTLNPKQKLALAKQLNLRPRQVEVWFQNRRARTKLKQTEVDCEYLKRCCETLTEENRRLQKELQELRALKTSQPFYMQLPATTLTMCPSCERVVTTASANTSTTTTTTTTNNHIKSAQNKQPRLNPFTAQVHMQQQHQGAAA